MYQPNYSLRKESSGDPEKDKKRQIGRESYVRRTYGEEIVKEQAEAAEPTYADQMAFLIGDDELNKEHFRTREVAEKFHVTPSCVLDWRRKGYINAFRQDDHPRGRYYYSTEMIRQIQEQAKQIMPYTVRVWPRYLAKLRKGEPIR